MKPNEPAVVNSGVTAAYARFVSSLPYENLPADVIHEAKRKVMDTVACCVSGSQTNLSRTLVDLLAPDDRGEEATVIGLGRRLSAGGAALVNGTSAHGLDIDDGYTKGSVHPGAAVVPALLAAAQSNRSDPRDLLAGVVAAYEVTCRLSAALHPTSRGRGFHATGTATAPGAAAGVSRLLRLPEAESRNALALSASFASGLMAFFDSAEGAVDIKRIHAGKAARDGLLCARMASVGVKAPSRAFEGQNGYFGAFGDAVKPEFLTEGLGQTYLITQTYIKPYPACRSLHGAIDAMLDMRAEGLRAEEVERIDVRTYGFASHRNRREVDHWGDAQFSIPYTSALALILGQVSIPFFTDEVIHRPDIRDLASRCYVVKDEECEREYPAKRTAIVTVTTRDGKSLERRVDWPFGEPQKPMSDAQLEAKMRDNCEAILGRERCERVIEQIWTIDRAPDITAVMESLS